MPTERQVEALFGDLGELIDSRDEAADLERFEPYADDPVGFLREVLDAEPWSRQVEVARAVLTDPLVAVRSCNGAGKDWLAARLALWWCYARRGLVVLTGPTAAQVEEILMRKEVASAFRAAGDLPGELHVRALRPEGEGRAGILAKTATAASALTGFHESEVLFVLTEAQGVDDLAFDAAFAVATGAEDRVLALGNPLNPSGRFYRASRPSSDWTALRIPASETPNVREDRVVIPGLMTREGVERIAAEYGRESGYYQSRVEAEFPEEAEEGVFRRDWLNAAAERWEDTGEEMKGPVVCALDPARFGPDASVLAIRQGPVLRELLVWEGREDTMALTDRTVDALEDRGLIEGDTWTGLVVDEVGLGGGVLDRLRERGFAANGFNGGRQAHEPDRYYNRRAESYWILRRRLERGEVALPPSEELAEELLALRWRPTPSGKVQLEAKADAKGRLGRSPDRADAVAMVFAVQPRGPTFERSFRWEEADGFVA